jgi:hypothetical protein
MIPLTTRLFSHWSIPLKYPSPFNMRKVGKCDSALVPVNPLRPFRKGSSQLKTFFGNPCAHSCCIPKPVFLKWVKRTFFYLPSNRLGVTKLQTRSQTDAKRLSLLPTLILSICVLCHEFKNR